MLSNSEWSLWYHRTTDSFTIAILCTVCNDPIFLQDLTSEKADWWTNFTKLACIDCCEEGQDDKDISDAFDLLPYPLEATYWVN